ncbi:proteinase-activated receptor 3-like [Scyliorhinus canicula]|uniref:proteinase-activated receptor 3-like n=1 Tax=Scyliorhinus canicula TaxID=7830 RepID=UPI0018F58B03|nr:proteinase-activated receptor 3-like [Scyliorhinus canicula]
MDLTRTLNVLAVSAILLSSADLCHSEEEFSGQIELGRGLALDPIPTKVSNNQKYVLNESGKYHLTSSITTALTPALYIIIFVIGLPTNGMAVYNLITKVQRLPSTIFLINLAAADLLLILVLPFKISYHLLGNDWLFGEGLCRAMTAFFYGNMYCSILLLTFISIDRYFALVRPFLSRRFRDNGFAVCCCLLIWLIVTASMIPFLTQQQTYLIQDLNVTTCHDVLPRELQSGYFFYYFVCLVVFEFLIPCFVTIFCYVSIIKKLMINDDKYAKAIRAMVLVLIVYLVCFTPSNIILLIHHSEYRLWDSSELYLFYMLCLVLSTFNNCIDPFIYYYISDEFRDKVRSIRWLSKVTKGAGSKKTLIHTDSSSVSKAMAPAKRV